MSEREWTEAECIERANGGGSQAWVTPNSWLVDRDGKPVMALSPSEVWMWSRRNDVQIVDAATAATLRDYHAAVAELTGIDASARSR